MRQIIRTAVLALGLLPAIAAAQVPNFPQTLPANTVVGRLGTGPGPSQAIPFATLGRQIGTVSGTAPSVVGHIARWANTTATVLEDFAGTSGGLAYFTSTGAVASSALLTQYGPIYGGGAGATPVAMAAGTDGQLIIGQTGAAPAQRTVSGDVTISALGVTAIGTAKVTSAMLRDSVALSVIGRSANSAGVPGDIACTAGTDAVLRESGSVLGCGTIATAGIANNAVTNAKLATMTQSTIKGRAAGAGTGDPTDLTATQATAILNAFVGDSGSGGTKGLVPAPVTGDASKFLRGDGTFQTIPGGGDLLAANNLSDVANSTTARQNLNAVLAGHIYGLTLANNGTDATNDLDIAVGEAADSTNVVNQRLTGALVKRLDANWAAGTNQGMRNSGAAITNTTYHIYLVSKALGADVDIYAHASTTVATVITALQAETGGASYIYARRIGSIIRSGGAIVAFVQTGDLFLRSVPVVDSSFAAFGATTALTKTLSVPTGIVVQARILLTVFAAAASGPAYIITAMSQADTTPVANGVGFTNVGAPTSGTYQTTSWQTATNTSAQVRLRATTTTDSYVMTTDGWIDRRGRDG